ncbi:hypothetical protein [Vreelandella sp. V005]|uniref:hypothetical protein n=1 Tax=Vreelandella sp. V005 TaxID=3459608 RepID=UPI004043B7EA
MWEKIAVAAIAWYLPAFAVEPVFGSSADQGTDTTSSQNMERVAQIKGALDDEQREWFILSHGRDSSASFVESGDHITVDITGFVDDEKWETQESLSLSLTVSEEQLTSATVLHPLGETPSPPLYTSEGGDVEVTLTHYERVNHRVYVAGSIKGALALQVQLGEPPHQEETIAVDVTFDVEAQKVEF